MGPTFRLLLPDDAVIVSAVIRLYGPSVLAFAHPRRLTTTFTLCREVFGYDHEVFSGGA